MWKEEKRQEGGKVEIKRERRINISENDDRLKEERGESSNSKRNESW